MALINNTQKLYQQKDRQSMVSVAFYNIHPGNAASLFFQPQSSHGAK